MTGTTRHNERRNSSTWRASAQAPLPPHPGRGGLLHSRHRSLVGDTGRFLRFAFLGVTAALLAGCPGSGEEPAEIDELVGIDPSKQKVMFWHQHDGERGKALQRLISEFNTTNSHGIEVSAKYAGEYRDIYNRMPGAFGDGSPPQLVVAYGNQAYPYYLSNWVVDLAPYMTSSEWGLGDSRKDYFKTFLEQDEIIGV